jgi:glucokinase
MSTADTPPIIVADVGGTNGRFAIASFGDKGVTLSHSVKYSNDGLPGFAELLALYLEELGDGAPNCACFATAGPNDGRRGMLTNLGWQLDAGYLETKFGMDEVLFVNDFKALARMTPELGQDDSIALNEATPAAGAPVSVLGPGTGLGVAMVLPDGNATVTIGTEGGHMAFAPGNALEASLRQHLATDYPHVFAELLLSGNGICRIHDFMVAERGEGSAGLTAAAITDGALAGEESCLATVQQFLSILGSIAGDVALCHGALGGVFLGGGIVKRIVPLIETSDLCKRFCAKGVMADYLSEIPIRVITADQVARRGAALLFHQHRLRQH